MKYRFAVKNEKQKQISTLKNLSPRWISIQNPELIYIYIYIYIYIFFFFSFYSQRLTTLRPPRRGPFWISRKNAKHGNSWDPELDFLLRSTMRMDFSALKVVFRLRVLPQNPNSRFQNQNPDSLKLRTQIFLKTTSSFWLAKTSSQPSFLTAIFKMADELPRVQDWKNRCRTE